jgi:hypothetical protein
MIYILEDFYSIGVQNQLIEESIVRKSFDGFDHVQRKIKFFKFFQLGETLYLADVIVAEVYSLQVDEYLHKQHFFELNTS